jgi:hypothetical protein
LNSAASNHFSDEDPLKATKAVSHSVHHASGLAVSVSSPPIKPDPFSSKQCQRDVFAHETDALFSVRGASRRFHAVPNEIPLSRY